MQSSFQGVKQVLLPSCGTTCLLAAHRQCAQFVADKVAGSKLPVELVDMIADLGSNRAMCLAIATVAAQQNVRGRTVVSLGITFFEWVDKMEQFIAGK